MNWGFPDSSVDKESPCNTGNPGLIPGLGRSPGEGKGYPLQYSGLENSRDCIVHGVAKSWTRLSNFDHELASLDYSSNPGKQHPTSLCYNLTYKKTDNSVFKALVATEVEWALLYQPG